MARLLIHVEGQTEESFVNEILRDHLVARGYHSVDARIVGNARLRQRRGGIRSWPSVKKDIVRHLKSDPGCVATTMVDFYALPQDGTNAWLGRATATQADTRARSSHIQKAIQKDLESEMGGEFNAARFVPYVVMHEFEGLLFSDCDSFSRAIGRPDLAARFGAIREQFVMPEDINDSSETAPSKRVEGLFPGYQKPLLGALAILEIGLSRICDECPNFKEWLTRLESLS